MQQLVVDSKSEDGVVADVNGGRMARLLHLKNFIIIFKLAGYLERAKAEYRRGRFFSANWCHRKFFRRKEFVSI